MVYDIIKVERYGFPIAIPKSEMFRVDSILSNAEYPLPKFSRGSVLTIADVGANVGIFTLLIKREFPNALIYCFEPFTFTFNLLVMNTEALANVSLFKYALGDRSGLEQLIVNTSNTGENRLASVRQIEQGEVAETVQILNAGEMLFKRLNLRAIDILKIDTEGSEAAIFSSLIPYLPSIYCILFEYHSQSQRKTVLNLTKKTHEVDYHSKSGGGKGIIRLMRSENDQNS